MSDQYEQAAHQILARLNSLERERLAFSLADVQARVRLAASMAELGLAAQIDDAGNVFGRLEGREPGLAPLVAGSHLDTVADPGRFDGALGVFCALECARLVAASGEPLRHPLLVSALADEEGTAAGFCFGSRALLGRLTDDERRAAGGETSPLGAALTAAATEFRRHSWDVQPARLLSPAGTAFAAAAYLELHIEQGPALGPQDPPVAVLRDIAGIDHFAVVLQGIAGHPATVATARRGEAVLRAASFIQRYWPEAASFPDAVVNIGRLEAEPGEMNVTPAAVRVYVEHRSPSPQTLARLETRLREIAGDHDGEVEVLLRSVPVPLDLRLRDLVRAAAEDRGIECGEVSSWAGHDAAQFSDTCPAGMISVRNVGGVSHSPQERAEAGDIAAGLELLHAALLAADAALP